MTLTFLAINAERAFSVFDEGLVLTFDTMPIFAIVAMVLGLLWLIALVVSLWTRRWRDTGLTLVSPFLIAVFPTLVSSVYSTSLSPRFLIERPRMEREAAQGTSPHYREFHWDETGFGGIGNTSQYMVYDETDHIQGLVAQGGTRWPREITKVESLGRHFFLVIEDFDRIQP